MELMADILSVVCVYVFLGGFFLFFGIIYFEFLPKKKEALSVITLWPIYIVFLIGFKILDGFNLLGGDYDTEITELPVYNVLNGEEVEVDTKFFDHENRLLICSKKHLYDCHGDDGKRCVYFLSNCAGTKCMVEDRKDRQGVVFTKIR